MASQSQVLALLLCVAAAHSLTPNSLRRSVDLSRRNGTSLRSFPKVEKIRMRDGILLHSVLTLPGAYTEKYACVIDRSPYGPFGTELIADAFLLAGYAALGQDFRGNSLFFTVECGKTVLLTFLYDLLIITALDEIISVGVRRCGIYDSTHALEYWHLPGTYQSEGDFNLWKHSYNDTYDTIEWIQQQPWSNGEIFMVGASADGIVLCACLHTGRRG